MASGKRASMREGPLADLFRRTEAEQSRQAPAEPVAEAPRTPTPQERLRQAFSSDLPENLMSPPSAPQDAWTSAVGRQPIVEEPVGVPQLRVVGVGGAGVNAVNRMIEAEVVG